MSFSSDVHRIAKDMGVRAETLAEASVVELFTSVIRDTPVDEGRLRGNWQTTENSPATGELDRMDDKNEGGAVEYEVNLNVNGVGTFYLTNNLPYAQRVEFGGYSSGPNTTSGFSNKAPRGMVRKNAKRINQIVRKKARGLN